MPPDESVRASRVQPFRVEYSTREAAKIVNLPQSRIRSLIRAGFLEPRRSAGGSFRFSFHDLIVLRLAADLSTKLSPRKLIRALKQLRGQLPRGRQLNAVSVSVEGEDVVVRDGGRVWTPGSGQFMLDFSVSNLVSEATPFMRKAAAKAVRESAATMDSEDWYAFGCEVEVFDLEQARDAYRRSLELEPEHPDAHINLGRLLHEAGETAAAREHYLLALKYRPNDATALYNIGVSLQDMKRSADAIKVYKRVLELEPRFAEAHYNLAQLYERDKRRNLALRHYREYRDLIQRN